MKFAACLEEQKKKQMGILSNENKTMGAGSTIAAHQASGCTSEIFRNISGRNSRLDLLFYVRSDHASEFQSMCSQHLFTIACILISFLNGA